MPITYISLGSNIGDRVANLREAISRLSGLGQIKAISSIYETEPVDFTEQPWFLNCVVELQIELSPSQLLDGILEIEKQMGRFRQQSKGPRNIDLDILLFADQVLNSSDLTVPHPSMHQRRFVLKPLAEIAPEAWHPVFKKNARQLLDGLVGQAVKRVTER